MEQAGPCKEHVEVRWDRVRAQLPDPLKGFVESNHRKGYRLTGRLAQIVHSRAVSVPRPVMAWWSQLARWRPPCRTHDLLPLKPSHHRSSRFPRRTVIRRRLADLSRERTLLRQLLRIAVRREATDMAPTEEAADA